MINNSPSPRNPRWLLLTAWPTLATVLTFAQSTPPNPPEPADTGVTILSPFEVNAKKDDGYWAADTIGATKTNTKIRDLPMTINAITADFMHDIGARNFAEALAYQAGVNVPDTTNNNTPARIRGLPSQFYLRDGVLAYRQPAAAAIERIEVIRGAAGIVYGESEPGGVINVITKKAQFSQPWNIFGMTVDNHGSVSADFDTNLVNADKTFAVRVAGSAANERYRYESMTGKSYTIIPSFRWQPTKSTEVMFQVIDSNDRIHNFDPGIVVPGLKDTSLVQDSSGNPYQYNNNLSNPIARLIQTNKSYGLDLTTFFPAYVKAGGTATRDQLLSQLNRFGSSNTTSSPSGMDPAQTSDPFRLNPFKNSGLNYDYRRTDIQLAVSQKLIEHGEGLIDHSELRVSYNRIADVMKQNLPVADYHNGNLRGIGSATVDGSGTSFGPPLITSAANPFRGTNSIFYGFKYVDLANANDAFNVDSSTNFNFGEAGKLHLLIGAEHAVQKYFSPQDATGDHWQEVGDGTTYASAAGGGRSGLGYAGWGVYNLDTGTAIPPQQLPARKPASETTSHLTQQNAENAFYATAQYQLFDDTVELLGALRYSNISRDDARYHNVLGGKPAKYTPLCPQYGVTWKITDSISWYASESESFQYESNHDADVFGHVQPPTKGRGFETGFKTSFFNGRLSADLAFFNLNLSGLPYKDPSFQQVYLPNTEPGSAWTMLGAQYLVNPANPAGAKAVVGIERFGEEMNSKGVELQIFYSPSRKWDSVLSASHNKATISKGLPELNGTEILDNPKVTASLWNIYKFRDDSDGLKVGFGTRYIAAYQTSWAFKTKPAHILDAMASYRWKLQGKHNCTLQFNAKNLTDKLTYSVDSFPNETSFTSQNPTINGQGRVYDLSVRFEF